MRSAELCLKPGDVFVSPGDHGLVPGLDHEQGPGDSDNAPITGDDGTSGPMTADRVSERFANSTRSCGLDEFQFSLPAPIP